MPSSVTTFVATAAFCGRQPPQKQLKNALEANEQSL
jgi:hypothetical protein